MLPLRTGRWPWWRATSWAGWLPRSARAGTSSTTLSRWGCLGGWWRHQPEYSHTCPSRVLRPMPRARAVHLCNTPPHATPLAHVPKAKDAARGRFWFVETDLRSGSAIRMDKTGKSVLMLLRHLGRLAEVRRGCCAQVRGGGTSTGGGRTQGLNRSKPLSARHALPAPACRCVPCWRRRARCRRTCCSRGPEGRLRELGALGPCQARAGNGCTQRLCVARLATWHLHY
jgi:hypothetical protein